MDRDQALAILRKHAAELRAAGVEHLSVFGSVARGDATDQSDVDVAVCLTPQARLGGFDYFGRLEQLTDQLEAILDCRVDLVVEPVRKDRLHKNIERERAIAF